VEQGRRDPAGLQTVGVGGLRRRSDDLTTGTDQVEHFASGVVPGADVYFRRGDHGQPSFLPRRPLSPPSTVTPAPAAAPTATERASRRPRRRPAGASCAVGGGSGTSSTFTSTGAATGGAAGAATGTAGAWCRVFLRRLPVPWRDRSGLFGRGTLA